MKTIQRLIVVALTTVLLALPAALTGCGGGGDDTSAPADTNAPAATMTGAWSGSFNSGETFSMSLTQGGTVLSGTYVRTDGSGSGPATGQLSGDTLDLTTVREPGHTVSQWHGTANADRTGASGTWTNITGASSGTFSMNKS